jgi:predicted dehydrogenase
MLVGAGSMGSNHARVIAQNEACDLAVVVEASEDAGRRAAERWSATYRPEIGSLQGIDAVVIAAATEAHYDLASQVLAAGLPVFVEKPLTPSLDQTKALLDASRRVGVPIMCGFVERYNPAVLTARALVGSPVLFQATRHSPYTPRIRQSVAWDLMVHDVDMAVGFMGGQVKSVRGVGSVVVPGAVPDAEDIMEAAILFSTGGIATISASRTAQCKMRSAFVYERERQIEIDLLQRNVVIRRSVGQDVFTEDALGNQRSYKQQSVIEIPEIVTAREPLASQLDHFLKLVAGSADADQERSSILPAHDVVARVVASAAAARAEQ